MGYTRHHAIVVTSSEAKTKMLHEKAVEMFGDSVTGIIGPVTNAWFSFMIAPDGSKEGWDESSKGDERRDSFIEWMEADPENRYADWAEVQFGDDDGDQCVTRASR